MNWNEWLKILRVQVGVYEVIYVCKKNLIDG